MTNKQLSEITRLCNDLNYTLKADNSKTYYIYY